MRNQERGTKNAPRISVMGSEGMRNWAKIKKLENERHDLEKKITELMKRLREVEEEIHKLGGM